MSREDNSVKHWRNLPISNPKPDLLNINALYQVWLKSLDINSSYRPETKIEACLGLITPSKYNEICPLAIPNQISTISIYISSLVKSIDVYLSYHPETRYGWTDKHMVQRETIIRRHYRVPEYKIMYLFGPRGGLIHPCRGQYGVWIPIHRLAIKEVRGRQPWFG